VKKSRSRKEGLGVGVSSCYGGAVENGAVNLTQRNNFVFSTTISSFIQKLYRGVEVPIAISHTFESHTQISSCVVFESEDCAKTGVDHEVLSTVAREDASHRALPSRGT
jgi:hypothetical protein